MCGKYRRKNLGKNEAGQAIFELSIILPLLTLMIISTVDVGRALTQYLTLTRITYEGARYAASLPGLEENDSNSGGFKAPSGFTEPNQVNLHSRISKLLDDNEFRQSGIIVSTEYSGKEANEAPHELLTNSIRVSITVPFDAYFGAFKGLSLNATSSGPYLFPDNV